MIKHTAFYIQMHLTSFLKEKKRKNCPFYSSDLPDLFRLRSVDGCVGDGAFGKISAETVLMMNEVNGGVHRGEPGLSASTGKKQKILMKPIHMK